MECDPRSAEAQAATNDSMKAQKLFATLTLGLIITAGMS
jgi:hypothetical protein